MKKNALFALFIAAITVFSIAAPTALEQAAAALSAGESADFTSGWNSLTNSSWEITWQTIWHYDCARKEGQYMGKPQSGVSINNQHYIYDEAANQWRTTGQALFPGTGHIWDITYNYDTGDFWWHRYNDSHVKRMTHSTESWDFQTATESDLDNLSLVNLNGIVWHPNLYGQGDGGLITNTGSVITAWRESTNTWEELKNLYTYTDERFCQIGMGVYMASADIAVFGGGWSNDISIGPLWQMTAGNNGSVGTLTNVGTPPIKIGGGSGSYAISRFIIDPNDDTRLLLLEKAGSGRVWTSDDYGDNWTLESFTHPLEGLPGATNAGWIPASVPAYGVVWGLTSTTNGSMLWKPPTPIADNENIGAVQAKRLMISANPNPFRSVVAINVRGQRTEDRGQPAEIKILDISGKIVYQLTSDLCHLASGISWNATRMPAGVYMVKIRTGGKTLTRRIILQR